MTLHTRNQVLCNVWSNHFVTRRYPLNNSNVIWCINMLVIEQKSPFWKGICYCLFLISSSLDASGRPYFLVVTFIRKTRLFKYIENFTSKNWKKKSDKNCDILAHLSRRLNVRYCNHSPSVVVVRLSVRPFTIFKKHLLLNQWLDFDQTSQERSLVGPLSKLFKWFRSIAYLGHRS